MKLSAVVLTVFLSFFLTGCVTGRRAITLPVASDAHVALSKPPVAITSITDNRTFENKPGDPSTPSIDGDVTKLSPEEKSHFIGRQRGGFGKAMGDITFDGGETVQNKVRQLFVEALARRGIAESSTAETQFSVEIVQFWAWFTPGVFYLTFESQLECRVQVTKGGTTQTFRVKGHGDNKGQVAKDGNWQESYARAFDDFLKNLSTTLDDAGL